MKKVVVIMMMVLTFVLGGCSKVEDRNYFYTDLDTGLVLTGLTQQEFKTCLNLYESYKMFELEDYLYELKKNPEIELSWDEDIMANDNQRTCAFWDRINGRTLYNITYREMKKCETLIDTKRVNELLEYMSELELIPEVYALENAIVAP